MIATLSQLRGCFKILHLGKRTIFAGLSYFSVSGVVSMSGKHCLQLVWSKVATDDALTFTAKSEGHFLDGDDHEGIEM